MATEGDALCGQDGGTTADDRISGLTDDLLHSILLLLDSTPEAARTSVLSRRWRHVWAALPELCFYYEDESPTQPVFHRIGEALAAFSAPTVDRLEIAMPSRACTRFPVDDGVARWLRFASQRLTGELCLTMGAPNRDEDEEGTVLPPCARATAIHLDLFGNALRFGPATAGTFTALSTLRIEHGHMDSRELEDVVSSRCPVLKELVLGYVYPHGAPGLCVRSDSLEHLEIFGAAEFHGRLEVDAPKLRSLSSRCSLPKTHIVAPMLSEVCWHGYPYNMNHHHLVDVERHLHRLDIEINSPAAALMKLFDTIEDLNLTVNIPRHIKQYRRFLKNINNVPKCEILLVRLVWNEHAFMSTMLYPLNTCTFIRKLEVFLGSSASPSCPSCCPCRLPESLITDSITLDSLEEVEIYFFEGSDELLELIELLSNNAEALEKIAIRYESSSATLLSKEVCEKTRRMCYPNIKVEFTVLSCWERVNYYS